MQFKTGSYVGTGIPHGITWLTEPFFTPDVVVIKADDSQYAVFRTSAMPAFMTAAFGADASLFSSAITAFLANTFQIGSHSTVNANGINYYWAAFADNGVGDMDVGSYVGDGADNRNLDIVGFQPTILWIKSGTGSDSGAWRVPETPAEECGPTAMHFGFYAPGLCDSIQTFRPLGFQLGRSYKVNRADAVYYYVAFLDIAGLVDTGSYLGNGIDDRNINVGFEPSMVFVRSNTLGQSVLRIDTMPTGQSGRFLPDALTPDRIQGFAANIFQVGTNADVNRAVALEEAAYCWAAWRVGESALPTTSTTTLSTTSTTTLPTTSTTSTSTLTTTLTTTTLSCALEIAGTAPVLRIRDRDTIVNLLKRDKQSGYRLCGWTPRIADYKRGGIWQDSPLAEGRRLAQRRFGNVAETMNLTMSGHRLETLIRESQDIRRLMEKASNYWWTNWQNDTVWIEARAKCETNTRYAILHRGKILQDPNPYSQPFMERRYGKTAARNLNLVLERGHWQSLPPECSASVLASARECYCWPYHLEFDGDHSTINCGSDAGLDDLPAAAFTAEAWVRADSMGENDDGQIISKTLIPVNGWKFHCRSLLGSPPSLQARIYCPTDSWSRTAVGEFTGDGEWHHVAMTWDIATYNYPRIWIDGVESAYSATQNRVGAPISDAAVELRIGNRKNEVGGFDGGIGWTRVSDVVRYSASFTPPEQCKLPDIDVNTIGQWIGPEDAGATVDNQEGTAARDGTLYNIEFACDCDDCHGNVDLDGVRQPVADHIYVANKRNQANITHIFRYDAAPVGFSGNLVGTVPFDLLPAVPAVGDIVYFGIESTPTDSGPFTSLVFDLENAHANITGIVWEFWWPDGAAWTALYFGRDNTQDWNNVAFGQTGINSVAWEGFEWTVAVNSVTGYWVRARVTSVGAAPTPPRQQNRDVYTVTWPYLEVDNGQVGGDIVALAYFEMVSAAFEADEVVVGLRSLSRGENFNAYLNFADEQHLPGITVMVSGNCAFADTAWTGTGRDIVYTAGANGKVEFVFGPSVCNQYYGIYHAYIRGVQQGGSKGDTAFTVSVELGSGQVVQEQITGLEFDAPTNWYLVDVGRLEISPPSLLDSNEAYNENKIVVDVSGTEDVHFFNLILIPIDEWGARFVDLEQGDLSTNRLQPGRVLEFESVKHPKQQIRANLWARNSDRIVGHWDRQTNGPAILQANTSQRLWVLASLGVVSRPEILTWFSVEAVQRYLSMRGDR